MRTNRFVLGLAALLSFAALAMPAEAAGPRWSGVYAGGALGYASATTETSLDVAGFNDIVTIDGLGAEGVSFTGLAGADVQVGSVVLGVWGSWTGDDLETSASLNVPGLAAGDIFTVEIEDRWAVGARAGYLVNEKTLVYGLAGYTEASTSELRVPILAASFAVPDLKGIVYGGGIEVEVEPGLFLHAQYTYSDFDDATIALAPGLGLDFETHVQEARVGATYKFNVWDAR